MAVNKVLYGDDVLIDLTGDNVTADALVTGHTAHGPDGKPIAGANPYAKAATDAEVSTQETLLDQALAAIANKAAGGGGGSVETCTVNVNFKYGAPNVLYVHGTCVDGGSIGALDKFYEGIGGDTSTYTFDNIVKDSGFAIYGYNQYQQGSIEETENCELLYFRIANGLTFYKITGTPATITIVNAY